MENGTFGCSASAFFELSRPQTRNVMTRVFAVSLRVVTLTRNRGWNCRFCSRQCRRLLRQFVPPEGDRGLLDGDRWRLGQWAAVGG